MIAPFVKADRDRKGRIIRAEPVYPVSVSVLHIWNFQIRRLERGLRP